MADREVTREVGVSAALIHNHYPTIAEAIRKTVRMSAPYRKDS